MVCNGTYHTVARRMVELLGPHDNAARSPYGLLKSRCTIVHWASIRKLLVCALSSGVTGGPRISGWLGTVTFDRNKVTVPYILPGAIRNTTM